MHNHTFVSRDCIEIVLDNKRLGQYHDNNHDKLYNRTDQVHAMILLEDILPMIYKYLILNAEVVPVLEYMRQDKLLLELSMKCLE